MTLDIYTPIQLAAIMFDPRQTITTSQWLSYFPNPFLSTQEEIAFGQIKASRKIAPFMLPNLPGRPIYRREGEEIKSFKPAYTKPKDAVRPSEMLAMTPGEIMRRVGLMTPEARYDLEVNRIVVYHRNSIQRLWDYMAAKSLLDGQIVIPYYDANGAIIKRVTLDFGRAAGHTITLGGGSRWGDVGVNIFTSVQSMIDTMANAEFGGSATDLVMGATAAAAFLASEDIDNKMKTNDYGRDVTGVDINRGIIRTDPMNPFTYLGTLGTGLRCWRYAGPGATFENDDGTFSNIMDPRDVLLISPSVDGVQAFGAILDTRYNLQVTDVFTKMWDEEDPSARFIMSQSAPLMIPVNPNCTLRARVVA